MKKITNSVLEQWKKESSEFNPNWPDWLQALHKSRLDLIEHVIQVEDEALMLADFISGPREIPADSGWHKEAVDLMVMKAREFLDKYKEPCHGGDEKAGRGAFS